MERRIVLRTLLHGLVGLMVGSRAAVARSRFPEAPGIQFEGKWGLGNPDTLELITTHAMDAVLSHLHPAEIASLPRLIKVRFDEIGPMAVYEGEPGRSPALVLLSATDRYWAQYLYQFSHELGHIACNFRRTNLRENRFQWLEESICGAISLYCLEHMANNWPFPAGHAGHEFGESLWGYLSDRRRNYLARGAVGNVRGWYLDRVEELAETREFLPVNKPFAIWLVDRMRADPTLIASIRYLNLWSNDSSASLTEQLLRWKRYCLNGREGLPVLMLGALGDVP